MRISDWSSDVCSSDLQRQRRQRRPVELEAGGEFGRKMLRVGEAATIARENDLATGPQRGQAGLGQPFQPAEHCRTAQHRLLHGNRIFDLPADKSEEHTSELQSLMRISYAVFCLKNKTKDTS